MTSIVWSIMFFPKWNEIDINVGPISMINYFHFLQNFKRCHNSFKITCITRKKGRSDFSFFFTRYFLRDN